MVDSQLFSSGSDEWYTPEWILDLVTKVMGSIDLDPCSDPYKRVPAKNHFTKEDNGLDKCWFDNVFLNPPYGRKESPEWIKKAMYEQLHSHTYQQMLLLPARTDTKWFNLLDVDILCFLRGRVKFVDGKGLTTNPAPFPSVLTYSGHNKDLFVKELSDYGLIYKPIKNKKQGKTHGKV